MIEKYSVFIALPQVADQMQASFISRFTPLPRNEDPDVFLRKC